ncbi:hypothetical protein ACP70R_043622 [Stipagrostis hirtigluma subsp. patula]
MARLPARRRRHGFAGILLCPRVARRFISGTRRPLRESRSWPVGELRLASQPAATPRHGLESNRGRVPDSAAVFLGVETQYLQRLVSSGRKLKAEVIQLGRAMLGEAIQRQFHAANELWALAHFFNIME